MGFGIDSPSTRGDANTSVVILQHYPGTVKQYADATSISMDKVKLIIPDHCPHPECQSAHSLIRWGSYPRWVLTLDCSPYRLRIQRLRCKVCGRTHSLLPDFIHPFRHYAIDLLQIVISFYLISGLSITSLTKRFSHPRPARSTIREWIISFGFGAGVLIFNLLLGQLIALNPACDLPDSSPKHLERIHDPTSRCGLIKAHFFLLLAEQLYALTKNRLPHLHFTIDQLFPFLLHWLQIQALPPRLFWSPRLSNTPRIPF
ncbi:MAG: hypothetical protein JXA42_19045 [Anaerolineales bacterium]|nr:hypothetical protein [Anaerolineales bacterium]